jgi:hypothetical protein
LAAWLSHGVGVQLEGVVLELGAFPPNGGIRQQTSPLSRFASA